MSKQTKLALVPPKQLKEQSRRAIFRGRTDSERELLAILSLCRTAGGEAERHAIKRFIDDLPDVERDAYGNRHLIVGDPRPRIAFSCHTDSVHWRDGVQAICLEADWISLAKHSKASCLGADCGTGLWLMRQMVLASVPGLYIFHRDEESGCGGSEYIVKETPGLVAGIDAMIAFDRKGKNSVITHQMGEETASEAFANSLCAQLAKQQGMLFTNDDGGSFTDSYTYREIISECTNVSVGYEGAHGGSERQSLSHATQLLAAMVGLDWTAIVTARDPAMTRYAEWGGFGGHYADYGAGSTTTTTAAHRGQQLIDLIRDYPELIADMLDQYGVGLTEVQQEIFDQYGDLV